MCAALAPSTERLRFLVAFRPGFVLPTLAAQMAATLQQVSGGRALVNIVTGGDPAEQAKYGDFLDHDARYARTGEFLEVFRRMWAAGSFDYDGAHYHVKGGGLNNGGRDVTMPLIYFGGASPAAEAIAAQHADVYLLWGEPPDWVAERIERMRKLAGEQGRELRFGIRLHAIAREREEDAWAEADRLLADMTAEDIEKAQANFARTQSVGQQRMTALARKGIGGTTDALVVAPNLWAGIGLVRGGAGTALVGSHAQVAERIREYAALGIDTFILSGYPHLEECVVVGEGVLSLLRDS
jgi:alkanesulfonate monooxygenase